MSTQVKHRRGTAAENAAFTGAQAEFVYLTDSKRVAIHDGVTAGGFTLPTAQDDQNNAMKYGTVGGTGNAITLTHAVPRTSHVAGAEVIFKPTANNTGAVTLAVDSISGTKALEKMVSGTSTALAADDLRNGVVARAIYDGTRYQLQTGGSGSIPDYQPFTASGTWTKPTNKDPNSRVLIECWGAGGGGGSTNGNGTNGGDSSFGSFVTAYGGGGGSSATGSSTTIGGGGGGQYASSGTRTRASNDSGVEGLGATSSEINTGGYYTGGGGGCTVVNGRAGRPSVYGGGGGGGNSNGAGGSSQFGGAGGAAPANAGTAPGGGGGGGNANGCGGGGGSYKHRWVKLSDLSSSETVTIGAGGAGGGGGNDGAAGARGEVRVTVF